MRHAIYGHRTLKFVIGGFPNFHHIPKTIVILVTTIRVVAFFGSPKET
jgi:hypothetical protein